VHLNVFTITVSHQTRDRSQKTIVFVPMWDLFSGLQRRHPHRTCPTTTSPSWNEPFGLVGVPLVALWMKRSLIWHAATYIATILLASLPLPEVSNSQHHQQYY